MVTFDFIIYMTLMFWVGVLIGAVGMRKAVKAREERVKSLVADIQYLHRYYITADARAYRTAMNDEILELCTLILEQTK